MNQLYTIIKRWWVALIFGILAICLGIYMFINPVTSYVAMSYVFAGYFLAFGIYKTIMTYKEREIIPAWGWSFALGIITIILGLFLLVPGVAAGTLVYYVAFGILSMGINACSTSFVLKDAGDKGWGWTLALGILTIVGSFFMMLAPVFSMGLITYWFGALSIIFGIQLIFLSYRLSVLNSAVKKEQTSH